MDRFSLNTVDDAIPSTMGHDSQSIVLKVPEIVGPPRHHLHPGVITLREPIALAESLHHDDGFKPGCQRSGQPSQRALA